MEKKTKKEPKGVKVFMGKNIRIRRENPQIKSQNFFAYYIVEEL
jgi:hypothetical protein